MKKTLKLLMSFVLLVSLLSMSAMATDGVDDIRFYDASSNKRIISFTENSEIYAKVNFTPTKNGTASVYAAFYRSNGALVKGEIIGDFAMTAGETIAYTTESFSALDVATVKLFAWDSNIVPLVKHGELEASDGETVDTIVKFESTKNGSNYVSGTQVTLGEIFTVKTGLEYALEADNISVTVSATDTAKATYTANETDWSKGTIDFSGVGNVTITITDNYLCTPASVTVMVEPFVTSFNADSGEYTFDDNTNYNVEDGEEDAVKVYGTAVVNITGGTYNGGQTPYGGSGNTAVYALGNSIVNISGGEFTINGLAEGDTGHIDLIYAKENATINISGGTFSGVGENAADVWLVNIKDADEDTAKIIITGGTFVNWNPAEKATDPNGKCYIAEGYSVKATVVGNDTHYTVVKNIDKFVAKSNLTFTHIKENGTIEKTLGDIFAANEDAEINNASVEVTVGEGCTYVKNDADWTASTLSFTGTGNVTITITDNVNCNTAEASVLITEPDSVEKFDIKSASLKVEQTVALGELFAEKSEVTVFDENITVTVTDAEGNSLADKITYVADATDWTKSTLTVNYVGSIKVAISDNNFCTATVLETEVAALDKFTAKEKLTFTHVKENGTIEKTLGDIFEAIEGADINSASVEVTVGEGCTYTKNDSDWTTSALSFTGTGDVTITITDNVNCKVATATISVVNPAPVEKFTTKAVEMKAEQTVVLGELFAEKSEVTVFDEDITVTVTDAEGNSLADKITYVADATDWTKSTLIVNYVGAIKVIISDNNFCTATVLETKVAALDKFTAKENLTFTHIKENGTIEKTLGDIFEAIEGADINSASVEVTVGEGCTYTKNDADWTASTLSFTGTGDVTITIAENCNTVTATVTLVVPEKVEKFDLVFENTDKYMYRVGNGGVDSKGNPANSPVALKSLFKAADGAEISDGVTVKVEPVYGDSVEGAPSAESWTASNWTNGKIEFNDTGVVKVTITDNNFCIPTELYLEVVDAINATTATSATSNDVVLLNDISGSFSVSGGHTFYGNGFSVTLPTSHTSEWGAGFTGYITLSSGNLDNVKIIGPVYPEQYIYREQAGDKTNGCTYFKNAVIINSGDCVISNSYISGARTAVYIKDGKNVVFDNTTVEGGAYANVEVSVSDSVTFNNFTSIQKEVENSYGVKSGDALKTVIGLGVVVGDVNAEINIEGTINQYNWVKQSQWSAMLGSYESQFPKLFTDSAYASYRHYLANDMSTPYVNLTFIFACDWDSQKINDNRTDKSIVYTPANAKVAGESGGVYSVTNAGTLTDELFNSKTYLASAQYPVEPVYSFDFVNKNYQEKTLDSNMYCYHDGSEVQISFDDGGSKVWDTSILSLEKNGADIAYTVTMNGTDYTGKSITFDESGTYEVVYSYTDEYNYKLGEDGSIVQYSKDYTKSVTIVVTEVAKLAQNANFAFGTSGLSAEKIPVENDTYLSVLGVDTSTLTSTATAKVVTGASATTSCSIKYNSNKTYGSVTISGNTFYFPIASMGTTDNKWSHTGSWYGCFPVFDGVVTITDYADGGQGAAVTYGSSTTTMPSNLAAINPQGIFVYQGTVSKVPTTPSKMTKGTYNGKLCYTTQTDLSASNERSEEWDIAKYEYKDNAGKTYYYYVGYYCAASSNGGCVTPETLITLADGSQKEVQDLTGEEMLLVWNHTTGAYDEAPVAYIVNHDTEEKQHEVVTLTFDDGKEIEIIGEHVFFNMNENKYVTLDSNAETFIGTEFAVSGDSGLASAKLINVEKESKKTRLYEVVTYKHMTCFTENILSASAYMDKLLNVFDIDDSYAYNSEKMAEDIKAYGLYTYEDFKDIVPEKTFELYNAAYLKVAVGKGYITWDDILALVEVYNDLGIVPIK